MQNVVPPLGVGGADQLDRFLSAAVDKAIALTSDPSASSPPSSSSPSSSSRAAPHFASPFLTPVQSALLYATRHVPRALDALERDVAFWGHHQHEERQARQQQRQKELARAGPSSASRASRRFGRDIIDADFLDQEIEARRERLRALREARAARHLVAESAVHSHVVQRVLAAYEYGSRGVEPTPEQVLRAARLPVVLAEEQAKAGQGGEGAPRGKDAPTSARDVDVGGDAAFGQRTARLLAHLEQEGAVVDAAGRRVIPTQVGLPALLTTRDELAKVAMRLHDEVAALRAARTRVLAGDPKRGEEGIEEIRRSLASLLRATRALRPEPLPSGSAGGLTSRLATSSLGASTVAGSGEAAAADTSIGSDAAAAAGAGGEEATDATTSVQQRRAEKLRRAVREMRAKREMVKGVLRGIILESTLDWAGDERLARLVLEQLRDESEEDEDDDEDEERRDERGDASEGSREDAEAGEREGRRQRD